MFNKLKQKVAEESKTDIASLNSNKTNNKNTIVKSNLSDGSQSADDAISNNTPTKTNANNNHNNLSKHNSIDKTESNSHFSEQTSAKFSLNDDQDDRVSINSQIHQLNQTLLKQIDDLTVCSF
jgi:hypothetical protein